VNQGVGALKTELVLLLNPDAEIQTPVDPMAEACAREGVGAIKPTQSVATASEMAILRALRPEFAECDKNIGFSNSRSDQARWSTARKQERRATGTLVAW